MQAQRYSTVAISLHWLVAALILVAFALGLSVDLFPRSWDATIVNIHVLLGLTILLLTLVRIWWRLSHGIPDFPARMTPGLVKAAHFGHAALYVLMLIVPMLGMPALFFRGRGIDLGLVQLGPYLARDPAIFRPLTEVHGWVSYALIALALGHVAAALYHQHVLKDDLLRRMGVG